jgi:hypothetical protein
MEERLGIVNKEDWGLVSSKNIERYPLHKFGSLQGLLE